MTSISHNRRVPLLQQATPAQFVGEFEVTRETGANLEIANRIMRLRRRLSWSQLQLSQASELSLRTIQRVEASGRCAPETLLALAAALDVEVSEFTSAASEHDKFRIFEHLHWLTPSRSALIGALFATPPALFLISNLGVYNLGLREAEWLFPDGVLGSVLSHPFVLLGLLAMALIVNLAVVFRISVEAHSGDIIVNRLVTRLLPENIAVLLVAGMTLTLMLGYVTVENLSHLLSGR